MSRISLERARAAKHAALERFGQLGTVTGVGITRVRGEYAVKVNLREPLAAGIDAPAEIDGVPVCIEVTGALRALGHRRRGE